MEAILMSIKPQHATNILNGKKTIEIRKRFPKDYAGWVYIYCTKGKGLYETTNATTKTKTYSTTPEPPIYGFGYKLEHLSSSGKVVARFWCDNVEEIHCSSYGLETSEHWYRTQEMNEKELLEKSCLTFEELDQYLCWNNGYAIHITKLEIFDKPKEISEFWQFNKELNKRFEDGAYNVCASRFGEECDSEDVVNCYRCWNEWSGWTKKLTRAPQSYCYIEV